MVSRIGPAQRGWGEERCDHATDTHPLPASPASPSPSPSKRAYPQSSRACRRYKAGSARQPRQRRTQCALLPSSRCLHARTASAAAAGRRSAGCTVSMRRNAVSLCAAFEAELMHLWVAPSKLRQLLVAAAQGRCKVAQSAAAGGLARPGPFRRNAAGGLHAAREHPAALLPSWGREGRGAGSAAQVAARQEAALPMARRPHPSCRWARTHSGPSGQAARHPSRRGRANCPPSGAGRLAGVHRMVQVCVWACGDTHNGGSVRTGSTC